MNHKKGDILESLEVKHTVTSRNLTFYLNWLQMQ